MATLPLTAQQEKLWRFIGSCERSPTVAEMITGMGLNSRSSIVKLLNTLDERGYIERLPGKTRSIVALDRPRERRSLASYSDAELRAELERRKPKANGRAIPPAEPQVPQFHPRSVCTLFGRWEDDARRASQRLLNAIEASGVRP